MSLIRPIDRQLAWLASYGPSLLGKQTKQCLGTPLPDDGNIGVLLITRALLAVASGYVWVFG